MVIFPNDILHDTIIYITTTIIESLRNTVNYIKEKGNEPKSHVEKGPTKSLEKEPLVKSTDSKYFPQFYCISSYNLIRNVSQNKTSFCNYAWRSRLRSIPERRLHTSRSRSREVVAPHADRVLRRRTKSNERAPKRMSESVRSVLV